jgi:hypothetical protein
MSEPTILGSAVSAFRVLRVRLGTERPGYVIYVPEEGRSWAGVGGRRFDYFPGRLLDRGPEGTVREIKTEPRDAIRAIWAGIGSGGEPRGAFLVSPDLCSDVRDPGIPLVSFIEPEVEVEISREGPVVRGGPLDLGGIPLTQAPPRPGGRGRAEAWEGEPDSLYERRLADAIRLVSEVPGKVIIARAYRRRIDPLRDPLDLFEIYATSEPNAAASHIIYEPGLFASVGCSPESVFEMDGDRISFDAMAATRPVSEDPVEDARLAEDLLADEKERREHAMMLGRAREFLEGVCRAGSVRLDFERRIRRLRRVRHLFSRVSGRLQAGLSIVDVLERAFPPLVSYPAALAARVEPLSAPYRFYGGMVGYVDGRGKVRCFLNLRTAVVADGWAHTMGGVGVVPGSQVESERRETANKLRSIMDAIEAWVSPGEGLK